jgi:hypothetical protein
MKDRLVTLLGALLALATIYALFFQRAGGPPITKPLSTEAGRNGYLALWNWLEREHVKVVSLRNRYTALLDDASLAESGNVLIVTMPFRAPLRSSEVQPFDEWIARGNTVLLLAALDDSPEWLTIANQADFQNELAELTALRFTTPRAVVRDRAAQRRTGNNAADDADDADEDSELEAETGEKPRIPPSAAAAARSRRAPIAARTEIELERAADHPLLQDVESLRGYSDEVSEIWVLRDRVRSKLILRLAKESSTGVDAFWQVPRGRGQLFLSASGSLLANRSIGEGDARKLVRNLLRYHLGPGGAVIFDDMHQGLSSLYDPAALLRDERLTHTIWFVLAAWLVYILGSSNRLAPPKTETRVPRQGDFVAAAGGFMARRLDRRAAGLLLIEEWLDDVRRARGLPPGVALWAELEATPTLARRVHEELHASHRALTNGRAVDLVRLHNTLKEARGAIG